MDNLNKKYLDRWEEKEFLTDWVNHAPAGSLDKSVDDILAELGLGDAPAKPAQPAAQPRPAQPAAQPRPAQPAAQPRPTQPAAQPRPAQPAAQPRPAQPAAQPRPAQPAPQPRPAQPAAQPRPAQPAAQPRPAQPAAQPRPAQPAPQPRPAQPAAQPRPAQPAAQPRPAQPAAQPRPAQPAAQPRPTFQPIPTQPSAVVTPEKKPLTSSPKPSAQAVAQPTAATAPTAKAPVSAPATAAVSATPATPTAPTAPAKKKKKKDKWIWRFLGNILPKKGDGAWELVRKGVCICAILVLLGSSCVLLNDFVLTPMSGTNTITHIDDVRKQPVDPDEDTSIYPAGILDSFKNLYKKNGDTIGWVKYKSTSPYWHEKLADPGYVVVQSRDNDFYLHRDFNKGDDRNGTIYMDYRCDYSTKQAADDARVTILYGHNMYSGLMFANVNKLLDSLSYAQSAPLVEFSSLYTENQYKVFAVISHDSTEEGAYNFLQTGFNNDQEFLEYITEARLRSWYNYNDVDVRADDKILILFTCSNTYQTTMGKEGRTILMARKVRDGESTETDISSITENTGKLMPRQWYVNNDLSLPEYYSSQDAAKQAVQDAMQ